ncbi:unnamed protein product [Ambrosiozyma monospora]|uniref:Unnamed protein product n=1 Tax=Ambrosiozyma monospora TaxID=43982 RepID=A0A9W6Z2H6_AMBMO|nr:unnamed protein product [Ambrosiozyma monospora]
MTHDSRLKTQDSRAPSNYNSKQLLTDSKLIIRFISMYIPSSNIPAHPAEHRSNLLCSCQSPACAQSISPCNSNNVRSIRKLTMCGENITTSKLIQSLRPHFHMSQPLKLTCLIKCTEREGRK